MMSMIKRRRGSIAHSRLYWRVKYFFMQNGGIEFYNRDVHSVWCEGFLKRIGVSGVGE